MKQYIAVLFAAIFIFYGCKKNDDAAGSSSYYIKFKANGELKTFSGQATFQYYIPENVGINFIKASLKDSVADKDPDYLVLALNGANIAHLAPADIPDFTSTLNFYYYDSDGKAFKASTFKNPDDNTDSFVSMDVTEITDKTIKGTFSAKAYNGDTLAVSITEGAFYVLKK